MSNIDTQSLVLSKENIQPLRHGRDTSQLSAALQAETDTESRQALEKQRNEFEIRLRNQNTDDPLSAWCEYIHWIEQSFPRQPREGKLHSVLQKCLNKFKDNDCYMNDVRFVKLCIKYADIEENTLELLSQVHRHGIGVSCAELYIAWAEKYAVNNCFKQANVVYEKGIKCQAQPLEMLKEAHANFQSFLVRRMLNETETFQPTVLDTKPRQAYNVLRPINCGQKEVVPNVRVGSNVQGSPGKLKQSSFKEQKPKSNVGIPIFQDDENEKGAGAEPQVRIAKIQSKKALTKENIQKPGKWTDKSQKNAPFSVGKTPVVQFQVHQDEDAKEVVPRPLLATSSVLKSHKVKTGYEDTNYAFAPLCYMEPYDPNVKPMYCKDQVYAGGIEFQFEELRAILYRRNKEEEVRKKLAEGTPTPISVVSTPMDADIVEPVVPTSKPEPQSKTKSEKKKHRPDSGAGIDARRKVVFNKPKIEGGSAKSSCASDEVMPATDFSMNQTIHTKEALSEMQQLWFSKPASPLINAKVLDKTAGTSVKKDCQLGFNLYVDESCLGNLKNTEEAEKPLDLTIKSTSDPEIKPPVDNPVFLKPADVPFGRKSCFTIYRSEDSEPQGARKKLGFETRKKILSNDCKENAVPHRSVYSKHEVDEEDKEDKENDVPDGYCGPVGKTARKFTGVLTPAEHVPTASLSDDEEENDNQEPDDVSVIHQCNTTGVTETWNFTKAFQFPKNESTPNPRKSVINRPNFNDSVFIPYTKEDNGKKCAVVECVEDDEVFLPDNPLTKKSSPRKEEHYTKNLSVIAETSREYKSSSSGSSAASTFRSFKNLAYTPSEARSTKYSLTPSHITLQKTKGQSLTGYEASAEYSHTGVKNSTYIVEKQVEVYESHEVRLSGKTISFDSAGDTCDIGALKQQLENLGISPEDGKETQTSEEIDPFSEEVVDRLLKSVKFPNTKHVRGCFHFNSLKLNTPKLGANFVLGKDTYEVKKLLGEGAYAKIFRIVNTASGENTIAKYQKPACPWEYYIAREVQLRIKDKTLLSSFMNVKSAFFYQNASVLLTIPVEYGDLLFAINRMKQAQIMCQLLSIYFTIQILEILETLHSCRIIHGDIKPDNFLVVSVNKRPRLQLIDFGRSIDMSLFPPNTSFNRVVNTEGFTCVEMQTGKPWTYQIDLYGAANCGHCLLYGEYMKVENTNGVWNITKNMPRYWARTEWKNFFTTLLNVPSCTTMPDIGKLKQDFTGILEGESELEFSIIKLVNLLNDR